MKVRREAHWKPQSPVRKGGVVYFLLNLGRFKLGPSIVTHSHNDVFPKRHSNSVRLVVAQIQLPPNNQSLITLLGVYCRDNVAR